MISKKIVLFFSKNWTYFLFLLIFSGLFFYYQINQSMKMRPQGLHQWRQSVGAGYAMNYYNYNLDIKQTRIFNNITDKGNSDIAFAEFPILYYFIAILYKIFDPNESIFRWVNFMILFIGLFYLMRALKLFLNDNIWSLILTILAFTSATLVYYSNSFLPDTSAYGIGFIAMFFILKFTKTGKILHIYQASILFTVAGLFKITSLIPFIALISTFILFQIFDRSFRNLYKLKYFVIPAFLPFVFSLAWYFFVKYYHHVHGGTISPIDIRPIWMIDAAQVKATWEKILTLWLDTYYHRSVLIMSLITFFLSLGFIKKEIRFFTIFLFLSLIGAIGFFFLFFKSLHSHDYYLINLFFLPAYILALGIYHFQMRTKNIWLNRILQLLFAGYLVFLITDCQIENSKKLTENNYWHEVGFIGLEDIESKLRELGINKTDKIICIPDPSINISLNMINQPGFTDYGFSNLSGKKRIEFFISKGAQFIIVIDRRVYKNPTLTEWLPYFNNKILKYKNVDVYDLRSFRTETKSAP